MKKGNAVIKAKQTPIEPEVLPPETKGSELSKQLKDLAEQVRAVKGLQAQMLGHIIGFAQCRIAYGIELLKTKEAVRLQGGAWTSFYKEHLAAPKFEHRYARMYMEVGRAWLKRAGSPVNAAVSYLNAAPASMTDDQRETFLAEVNGVTKAQTWQQLQMDLGLAPAQKPLPLLGGNAGLMAWLKEKHPECQARQAADLPAEIRAEWEAKQKEDRGAISQAANESKIRLLHKTIDQLQQLVERHQAHVLLSRPELERLVGTLGDVRDTMMEAMKK